MNAELQRAHQWQNGDFFRTRLRSCLPLAAADECAFTDCEVAFPAPGVAIPMAVAAWDAQGALQTQLAAIGAQLRLRALDGRPKTLFGPDVAAVAKALDQVTAVWVAKLGLGQ